jgi:hypothetical protein
MPKEKPWIFGVWHLASIFIVTGSRYSYRPKTRFKILLKLDYSLFKNEKYA